MNKKPYHTIRNLIIVLFCIIAGFICFIVGSIIYANITPLSDDNAYKLIDYYFGINMRNSSSIVYSDYDTNIREESFTIVVKSDDMKVIDRLLEKQNEQISLLEFNKSENAYNDFDFILNENITSFHIFAERDTWGRKIRYWEIPNDRSFILFSYDP